MKPAWDALGDEYASSSSVVIGDADCTIEKDLCSKHGVSGYPTIKYYTAETGRDGESYSGGRDADSLKTFVEDKLSKFCDVADESTCDEKEVKYLTKMKANAAKAVKELPRLLGMTGNSMKADLKKWLHQRINILKQLGKEEL
jgi:protein disulfide-isomerase A6